MITPVTCFTCGLSLGDLDPIYQGIRRKRVKAFLEKEGVAPTKSTVDWALTEDLMSDVLVALKVGDCCKTHLVTAMNLTDHY